jgi:hypothetical protein
MVMNRCIIAAACLTASLCSAGSSAQGGGPPTYSLVSAMCAPELGDTADARECGLGDYLTVTLNDLKSLQAEASKVNKKIVLFLNGSPLKGVAGEKCPLGDNTLRFMLARTDDPDIRVLWSRILGRPLERPARVSVCVGLEDASTTTVNAGEVTFPLLTHSFKKALALIALAVILLALLVLAGVGSNMLRDASPPPDSKEAPYSLARTQMAWWFFNIATAFLLIWATTGAVDTLTPQLLTLMGISAGTALVSAVVDSSKRNEAQAGVDKASAAQAEAAKAAAAAPADQQAAAKARLAEAELAKAEMALDGPKPDGFLNDLLTDVNGYSLHRLQLMVWTILLTIVFWASVWSDLAMPQFSETLLGLMGISSGTYIGFKLPEKHV